MCAFQWISGALALGGLVGAGSLPARKDRCRPGYVRGVLAALAFAFLAGAAATAQDRVNPPPRAIQAQRFLAERGWLPGRGRLTRFTAVESSRAAGTRSEAVRPQTQEQTQTAATATWTALGPAAVLTPDYGLVTGRVSALALDPSDSTGNCLYLGTTGGGVWRAQNAGTSSASSIVFTPLTDSVATLSGAEDASISIGALTVQPGTVSNCGGERMAGA